MTMKSLIIAGVMAGVLNTSLQAVAQAETILGIHARTWHAWISVTTNGNTTFYGLWKSGNKKAKGSKRQAGDIRINLERFEEAAASRYYRLTPRQVGTLNHWLNKSQQWGLFKNCAWWASKVVRKVIGEDVDANAEMVFFIIPAFGTPDPRELCESIQELESKRSTVGLMPKAPRGSGNCLEDSFSSSSSS